MTALSSLVLDIERDTGSSVISHDFSGAFGIRENIATSTTVVGTIFNGLSSKTTQFITRLESFKTLEPNWDSYGAIPPSNQNVNKAISFVRKTDVNDLPLFFVAPGPNGELVIEFKRGAREASAFMNPDGSTELILNEGDHYVLEGTVEGNYKDLLKFING